VTGGVIAVRLARILAVSRRFLDGAAKPLQRSIILSNYSHLLLAQKLQMAVGCVDKSVPELVAFGTVAH
jgi:hypothetical protein